MDSFIVLFIVNGISAKTLDSFIKLMHIPLIRAISSAGRASRLHRDGR